MPSLKILIQVEGDTASGKTTAIEGIVKRLKSSSDFRVENENFHKQKYKESWTADLEWEPEQP
jgi:uridine kinase